MGPLSAPRVFDRLPLPAEGGGSAADLLARAASILTRETTLNPKVFANIPGVSDEAIRPQRGAPSGPPFANGPPVPLDIDRLRRHLHEVIETVLAVFAPKIRPVEDRVPLIPFSAPVEAGEQACASVRVANEEAQPSAVSLYCSNFIADSGYDIPALRVAFAPKKAIIAPKNECTFEVTVSVPQQAPPGIYSGLILALGAKYVKAVALLEVR